MANIFTKLLVIKFKYFTHDLGLLPVSGGVLELNCSESVICICIATAYLMCCCMFPTISTHV
jgi:hypothetical protein